MDYLEEEFDSILEIFNIESEEIIQNLFDSLYTLEKEPNNRDVILALFKDAHSLKGTSRMVGFNAVQTLAHKLEDILDLLKEKKLNLSKNLFNLLSDLVKLLDYLIKESIKKKSDFKTPEFETFINKVDSTLQSELSQTPYQEEQITETASSLFVEKYLETSNILSDMILIFDNENPDFEKIINKAKDMFLFFKSIKDFEIKNELESISMKLEFVLNGTGFLNQNEIKDIRDSLKKVVIKYNEYCQKNNLVTIPIPYENNLTNTEIDKQEDNNEWKGNLVQYISELPKNPDNIALINNILSENIDNIEDNSLKTFIKKMKDVFSLLKEFNAPINESTLILLSNSLIPLKNIFDTKNPSATHADIKLLVQHLTILEKLLLKEKKVPEQKQERKIVIQQKNNKALENFYPSITTGEIKTLRIDSGHLDVIVNQIAELIITKIKTKEHSNEINNLSKKIDEVQKNIMKVSNLLRNIEKKYNQNDNYEIKKILGQNKQIKQFINENLDLSKLVSDSTRLYKKAQENETRLRLIASELEEMVKKIRVLPLSTIFNAFPRMVRDIGTEKEKEIELIISGAETSVDKRIIEEMKLPLMHLIRNAIDHGIELPEERKAKGKPPLAKINLRAKHMQTHIIIEIEDDGRGINLDAIKNKALEKKILTQEEISTMTEEQLMNMIFWPGFSTQKDITDISGRGIGLDIVQTKITQLNGRVSVKSILGKSCCVSISLPISVSTINSLLVSVSNQLFAMPMNNIKSIISINKENIILKNDLNYILYENESIPIFALSELLELENENINSYNITILIIESDNNLFGLVINKMLSEEEILIKKFSLPIFRVKDIAGITTLASGELCLVLNVSDLIKNIFNRIKLTNQETDNFKSLSDKTQKLISKEKKKILVVDDSATSRQLQKNILLMSNYNVDLADNGKEAVKKISYENYDLVLTDIHMPEMDGLELLKYIKTNDKLRHIPVIVMTSLLDEKYQLKAKELHADEFILKNDFKKEHLLRMVKNLIKH